MKIKHLLTKTLLVAAGLLVGQSALAQTTTLLEYGTGDVAWTAANLAEWTAGGSPTLADGIVTISGGNGGYETSKTITPTANAIINVTAVWRGASATGRAFEKGNGSYFRFGNIYVAQNDQDKKHGYGFTGLSNIASVTTFTAGDYRVDVTKSTWLKIEAEINTATNTLTSFTIKSEDGETTYATVSDVALTDADYTTVAFGYKKGGSVGTTNTEQLKSVKITQTAQAVTNVNYTINYKFEGEIIKTVEGTSVDGATVNAEDPIIISEQKYYATTTTSLTLDKDGENVLNVDLRKALTSTVNINAVDGESNILKTFSAERVEGDAASNLYYTRVVKYNDKYYKVDAANGNSVNYGRSMAYGDADVNITYTLDEAISYYAEENELSKSRSFAAQGQVPERASGGDWQRLYASSQVWTEALPAGIYSLDVSGRNQGSSTGTLAVKVRLSDGTLIDTGQEVSLGSSTNAVQNFSGIEVPEGASIALAETSGYNSNIALDYVIAYRTGDGPSTVTVEIKATGSTFSSAYAIDCDALPTGVKAYKVTKMTASEVTATEVTGQVAANTGLILKADTEGNYNIPVAATGEAVNGNLLKAAVAATEVAADQAYGLKDGKFHKLNAGTISAGKAYLLAPTSAPELSIVFGGEATGISEIKTMRNAENEIFFDLQGRKVAQPAKGLYIQNGRKVILK